MDEKLTITEKKDTVPVTDFTFNTKTDDKGPLCFRYCDAEKPELYSKMSHNYRPALENIDKADLDLLTSVLLGQNHWPTIGNTWQPTLIKW